MAYLDVAGIDTCINWLESTFPALVDVLPMPEKSVKNRTIRGIRLRAGSATNRRGVLIVGGVHARELVNPELVLTLAVKLCDAYTGGTGITLGGKSFSKLQVRLIMETLDTFLIPCTNPDGRHHVQKPGGDAMWRKNRANLPGSSCKGVDLNRNLDFLWHELLGATSDVPCSDVFHGPSAFSEPETRNVMSVLDAHPHIRCFADVHSYSELILYPWGDDDTQSSDTTQNFLNAAWDGLRGTAGGYAEYMPSADVTRHHNTGEAIRDSIAAVRGHVYTVQPSVDLYPTTGTHMDYAFSRHRADSALRKVYAFTFETGTCFQPEQAEKLEVIKEGTAGLLQLLVGCICAIELVGSSVLSTRAMTGIRTFRSEVMQTSRLGRRLSDLLDDNSEELGRILMEDEALRKQAGTILTNVWKAIDGGRAIPKSAVTQSIRLIGRLSEQGSVGLRRALRTAEREAAKFAGRKAVEVLTGRGKLEKGR